MRKKENKKKQAKSNKKATKTQKPAAKKTTSVKPVPNKNASKPVTKKQPAQTKSKSTTKREIKVGDKIVGQANSAVGIVKEIKTEERLSNKPKPYAVIEWQNPKKGQDKKTVAEVKYLQSQEQRGGIKITTPRKTANKSETTAPSTAKKQPTTKRPAKNASNRKQSAKKSKKQGEGEKPSHPQGEKRKSSVGEIHRGNTKYIDTEPKEQRDYAVVKDNDGHVTVAKVKSIKKFDENGKNADPALVEINHERYGLEKRSGVDFETFDQNRMTHKPLQLSDKNVFPEGQPRATLGSHDKHRVLENVKNKGQKKK